MQEREIINTGITSLKIAFNNVFGYYIEVRNLHKDKVPETWIRKQTLVSAERYITEELKNYESKILGAEEKILSIETRLYGHLVSALTEYIQSIQLNASVLAQIDCLLSFATIAKENKYYRPEINESHVIDIKNGRHPVIEQALPIGEKYITNDVYLDNEEQQINHYYRSQYGREISIAATNCIDCTYGSDGFFRSGRGGQNRICR